MADYIRTGTDAQGRRVGQRADGKIEVIKPSFLSTVKQALPQAIGQATRSIPGDFASSFLPGASQARSVQAIPPGMEEPVLSTVGGLGGGLGAGPVGAIAGSGMGAAAGNLFSQVRQGSRFDPMSAVGSGAKAAGFAGLGLGIGSGITGGAFKFLPQLAKSGLGRTAVSAASGAGAGAAMSPEHPVQGALVGGTIGAGAQGVAEGIGRLTPVKQTGLFPSSKVISRMPAERKAKLYELQAERQQVKTNRDIDVLKSNQEIGETGIRARYGTKLTGVESGLSAQESSLQQNQAAQAQQRLIQRSTQRQTLKNQEASLEKMLSSKAREKTLQLREPFLQHAQNRSIQYRNDIASVAKKGAKIPLTGDEVIQVLEKRLPYEKEFVQSIAQRLGANPEITPEVPATLFSKAAASKRISPTFTPEQIVNEIDSLGQQLPRTNKWYSPSDKLTDDARSALLDLLDQKGLMEVRQIKSDWAPWAKLRNRASPLIDPYGPADVPSERGAQAFVSAAKGKRHTELIGQIEKTLGQPIAKDLKPIVEQLSEVEAKKVQSQLASALENLQSEQSYKKSLGDVRQSAAQKRYELESGQSREIETAKSVFSTKQTQLTRQGERLKNPFVKQAESIRRNATIKKVAIGTGATLLIGNQILRKILGGIVKLGEG